MRLPAVAIAAVFGCGLTLGLHSDFSMQLIHRLELFL